MNDFDAIWDADWVWSLLVVFNYLTPSGSFVVHYAAQTLPSVLNGSWRIPPVVKVR